MSRERRKNKIGRNDPCPCGSGMKFKRCHGMTSRLLHPPPELMAEIQKKVKEHRGKEKQREQQQGLGRPIISTMFNGMRIVAVKDKIFYSDKWNTFHDFLFDYLKNVLTPEWGNQELAKPLENRHIILQWYDQTCRYQKTYMTGSGKVYSAPMTGAVASYLGLSYNLYLLQHNADIKRQFILRLRNNEQFYPAYYESFVAACLIKAGFILELEDETDGSQTHCEFTATCTKSGNKYSVEAKSREPGKGHAIVSNQLVKALKKRAEHKRIIFIDANVPDNATESEGISWLGESLRSIKSKEALVIKGVPAPEAYVVVTNHPCHLHLSSTHNRLQAVIEGYKISNFHFGQKTTLREALHAREQHADIFHLMDSIKEHYNIPITFDGEIPEFAFGGETVPRLIIGQRYSIPAEGGQEVVGELTDAVVADSEKLVYGVYQLEDGRSVIVTSPLTDSELSAYRQHPDTFFGVYLPKSKKIKDPIDLFDFFHSSYRNTTKEKLLEFMKDAPDIQSLKQQTQEELAITYCERMMHAVIEKDGLPNATDLKLQ